MRRAVGGGGLLCTCERPSVEAKKPTLGKKAANATPAAFRDLLLSIARGCA